MKCPHCQTTIHSRAKTINIVSNEDIRWEVESELCPSCNEIVIQLVERQIVLVNGAILPGEENSRRFIVPKKASRPAPSKFVPNDLANDYIEASLVLDDSPKASAALSRRCLQHLIRTAAGITAKDLATEIQKLIDSNTIPSHLSESVDAIRNIGNFAAHPIKSTATGEILEVEPGEAEWNLDVLDGLFDFYFIQPSILKAKKAALDAKLASAGKPPSK